MSNLQPRQNTEAGLLLDDIKTLIEQARRQVAVAVNAGRRSSDAVLIRDFR